MDNRLQLDIEKAYNRNQIEPRLMAEFLSDPRMVPYIESKGLKVDFAVALLVEMELCKRTKLEALVGKLRYHFKEEADPSQACADALYIATVAKLVTWDPMAQGFIVKITVSPDVREEIDRFQYPLPMVVEPLPVKSNRDTGYFTIKSSIILKNNHHDEDVNLDHINKVNRIALRINPTVAHMVKNRWADLDKCRDDEDYVDYQKRVKAFEKYDRSSRDVMGMLEMASNGKFYLTHKYDKRGRVYCQGYHVTYQGNDWNKAVIEFDKEEKVIGF